MAHTRERCRYLNGPSNLGAFARAGEALPRGVPGRYQRQVVGPNGKQLTPRGLGLVPIKTTGFPSRLERDGQTDYAIKNVSGADGVEWEVIFEDGRWLLTRLEDLEF